MFSLGFGEGEDFYGSLVRFVMEKRIRSGFVLFIGAFYECDIIPGVLSPSPPMPLHDQTRKHLSDRRDVHGHGVITWPEAPPETLLPTHRWKGEPEPYVHLHLTLSGGPGEAR